MVITNKTIWIITKKWRLIVQLDSFCMDLWWMNFIDGCYRNQKYWSLEGTDLKLTLFFCYVSVRNWVEFSWNIPTGFHILTYQDKPLYFIMHTILWIPFLIIFLSCWYILRICFSVGACQTWFRENFMCLSNVVFLYRRWTVLKCIAWDTFIFMFSQTHLLVITHEILSKCINM